MSNANEIPFDDAPRSRATPDGELPGPFDSMRTGTSRSLGALGAALSRAQGAMTAARLDSDGFMPDKNGGRRYRYASLESVRAAVRVPLAANELCVFHLTDDATPEGIVLVTVLLHASGEWIRERTPMPARETTAQAHGSAYTYAQRYALLAITGCTAAGEDDDAGEATRGESARGMNGPGPRAAAPRNAPAPERPERRQAAPRAAVPPPPAPSPSPPPVPAPDSTPFSAHPPRTEDPREIPFEPPPPPKSPGIVFASTRFVGMSAKEQETVEMFAELFAKAMTEEEIRRLNKQASTAVGGLNASAPYLAWHREAIAQARAGIGVQSPGPAKTASPPAAPRLSVVPNVPANDVGGGGARR